MRRTRNRKFSEELLAMASSEIPKRSDAAAAARPTVDPQGAAIRKPRGRSGLIVLRSLISRIQFRAFDFIGMACRLGSKRSLAVKHLVKPNALRTDRHFANLLIAGKEANARFVAKL
jgi:hypothetical protein